MPEVEDSRNKIGFIPFPQRPQHRVLNSGPLLLTGAIEGRLAARGSNLALSNIIDLFFVRHFALQNDSAPTQES
jgi:hypothetical protein